MLALVLLPRLTHARGRCLIVGISDGDTLKDRSGAPGSYQQVTVRVAEIDAPEKRQHIEQSSKEHLSRGCFQVEVTITPAGRDRYGRTLARVECRGADANSEQVRAGMDWAFTRYLTELTIEQIEQARAARRGLWVNAEPIATWEWRAEGAAPYNPLAGQARHCPAIG